MTEVAKVAYERLLDKPNLTPKPVVQDREVLGHMTLPGTSGWFGVMGPPGRCIDITSNSGVIYVVMLVDGSRQHEMTVSRQFIAAPQYQQTLVPTGAVYIGSTAVSYPQAPIPNVLPPLPTLVAVFEVPQVPDA